ncbi:hypothetical protein PVAP13_2KG280432 [Panicum virgatum]|uniref:Uncharacterized protein n=1 Tax=Panicum virgatum TaxID=38727 RepID=A0A8T0W1J9_PANVG|nr:hypothetical protein PVAP13_2KG280432 [Panicum virgatum]
MFSFSKKAQSLTFPSPPPPPPPPPTPTDGRGSAATRVRPCPPPAVPTQPPCASQRGANRAAFLPQQEVRPHLARLSPPIPCFTTTDAGSPPRGREPSTAWTRLLPPDSAPTTQSSCPKPR